MSLTQNDLKEIKELIGNEIAKNNLVLFELFEKRFATKDDLKGFATKDDLKRFATKEDLDNLWDKACEKFATRQDLMKLQDLVVLINHKLDTEYRFIQKRGEYNTQEIERIKHTLNMSN
jgi:hypothetical protein